VSRHLGESCALVPKPEERPAKSSAVSSPVCLNTKATSPYLCPLGAHARGETCLKGEAVSSPMCLNTKMTRDLVITPKEKVSQRMARLLSGVYLHQGPWLSTASYFLSCLMPTLEGGAPRHFLAMCLNIRQPGLVVLTWGGGVPKESVNPCPGMRRPDFNYTVHTFQPRCPCPESALPPLPLGCLNVRVCLRAWCPRPEEISASLLLRCPNTMVAGSFLNEPRHFFLAFLYVASKENSRQCILKLIFTWVTSLENPREGKKCPLNSILHQVFN